MLISVGDIIASCYGTGPIVAITNEWVVHNTGDGHEAALPIPADGQWWIPTTTNGHIETLYKSIDIDVR